MGEQMKLSDNFYLSEFVKSETASRLGIDNTPSPEVISNLKLLAEEVLQPLRVKLNKPVTITSGYRSPALNAAIGSSTTSQHTTGEAADFEIVGMDNKELAKWIVKNLVFDQLILEFYEDGDLNSGWVHCSYSASKNRKSVLTAKKVNNKTVYEQGIV
jgi:zinc D-Ala-D-Ala carboxypeptidase